MKFKLLAGHVDRELTDLARENTIRHVAFSHGPDGKREVLVGYTTGTKADLSDLIEDWMLDVMKPRREKRPKEETA